MPQRPKPAMRRAIVSAAADVFSERGFARATLGDIAKRAGTSVGNVYKYFHNKDTLFSAAIPAQLANQLKRKIRAQVTALGTHRNALALADEHPYRQATDELLRFSLQHRSQIVFLLRRAEGTLHAGFDETLVGVLVTAATQYAARAYPGIAMSRAERRSLTRTYRAFIEHLAVVLEQETSERALREAVRLLATYHLSGLQAFFGACAHPSNDPQPS